MARFDWLSFCERNRITFIERGPNVAKGHINVRCPFCGGKDPSEHMGLSLDVAKPMWGCFRDSRHRGRNPVWLVMRLLGCSLQQAKEAVDASHVVYSDDLALAVSRLRGQPDVEPSHDRIETLRFPSAIKPIDGRGYSPRFLDYLHDQRGFVRPYDAVDVGDLHYAVAGTFKDRLIFPIYRQGKLVTWVGRDITGRQMIRYRALDKDEEVAPIKECLYAEDAVEAGGDVLFVSEGPMDALKLNTYLPRDMLATCFFGMPTSLQTMKLVEYARQWERLVLLLDATAQMQTFVLFYDLRSFANVIQVRLPDGVKDPGELRPLDIRRLVTQAVY